MTTTTAKQQKLQRFGFRYGRAGAHSSRTIMLAELRALLTSVDDPAAPKSVYQEAIQVANCLTKRSIKTRSLTYHHLVDFYTLDPDCLLFRALRFFWQRDPDGQPLLAALCAYARDPVFRASTPFVLASPEGATVSRQALEAFIDDQEAGRFSSATLKSTAQNINASLTQAGHLSGRARKIRARAQPTPGSIAFGLLLGYLTDLRGEMLFRSEYIQWQGCSFESAIELAQDASRRGWISLKRVGHVVEVVFPNLITAQEMELLREPN